MMYRQITATERYTLMALHAQGLTPAAIARALGRHRSTITREMQRNRTRHDGYYRPELADWYARGRRSRSRRNQRFTAADWARVHRLLRDDWSPEQIAGRFQRHRVLAISHETIYRHVWSDKAAAGQLYRHLRCAQKHRRKRYGHYDSRGRLAGNRRARHLINAQPHPVRTITVDNGTEFHSYAALERLVTARFYFATPHLAWERGTNENTNGLLRQYWPKGASMEHLTQQDCTPLRRSSTAVHANA